MPNGVLTYWQGNVSVAQTTVGLIKKMLLSGTRYDRMKLSFSDYSSNFIDNSSNAYKKYLTIYNDVMWSVQNTTLTFSTKMQDNFMVANGLSDTSGDSAYSPNVFTMWDYLINGKSSVKEQNYKTLEPVRYVDLFGKIDFISIGLGHSTLNASDTFTKTASEISKIIRNNHLNGNTMPLTYVTTSKGIVLNKDNKETLRVNFNLHCVTDSDRICVSDQIWKMYDYIESNKLSLAIFYDSEINKQSRYIYSNDFEIKDFDVDDLFIVGYDASHFYDIYTQDVLYLKITNMISSSMLETKEIKSIALCKNLGNKFVYFIGKNLTGLTTAQKATNIYIDTGAFKKRTNEMQLNELLK